jgi:membrane-bound lytic murein transglycosylase D
MPVGTAYFLLVWRRMKRFLLLSVALLILVSCTSTGKVVTENDRESGRSDQVIEQTEQPQATDQETARIASQLNNLTSQTPNIEQPVIDEDDNIVTLLRDEDFQKFDIPIVFNDAVKYYIGYFTTEKRKVFGNWLKRARRYVPLITEILKEKGMPEDLVYLAMIESGFNPKAYSPAKACGPWQFIYATGGRYGLRVNFWIDERRDPEKSTVAAAKYLKDLFNQFGCWYLAAAGYNAGERRVERAIEKHNTNDFWELSKYNALPRETREYIPKLIAAAIIAKDPEKFGFGSMTYDLPIRFVQVKVPRATSISAIAKALSIDKESVRSYNPEIIRGITPPDMKEYAIKLPYPLDRDEFLFNLEAAMNSEKKVRDVVEYKVKKRDTMAKILKKYRLNQEDLYLVNNCDGELKVKTGMLLNIPRFASTGKLKEVTAKKTEERSGEKTRLAKAEIPEKTASKEKKPEAGGVHVVRKGETLAGISSRYGIAVASLKSENNLKTDKVYPNMKLRLASHARKKQPGGVKYHVVKKGETLSAISSKYGVDVSDLKSENNLKNSKVYPKMKLKIVTEEG